MSGRNKGLMAAAAVAVIAAATPGYAANLVDNGSFSSGTIAGWSEIGDYTTRWNSVATQQNGDVTPYGGQPYMLSLGNYPIQGLAGVSQVLNTLSGTKYDVSLNFNANGNPSFNAGGNQLFEVLWDNQVIGTVANTGNTGWTKLSYAVTGTGKDTLALEGYSDSGYNNIDNVSVAATPLPGALLLFGSGLTALAGFTAVRRRNAA